MENTMEIYEKYFNETNPPRRAKGIIRISRYLLPGKMEIIPILEDLRKEKSNDLYILGLIYEKFDKRDIQIFITGKTKMKEESKESACREIYEETRFTVDQSALKFVLREDTTDWYLVNIEDVNVKNKKEEKTITRDTKNRVSCIIYGTKDQIEEKVNELNNINRQKNDDIIGLTWFDIKTLFDLIGKVLRSQSEPYVYISL